MKVCTRCGSRNEYSAVRCAACGNPNFIADVNGYGDNSNYNQNNYGNETTYNAYSNDSSSSNYNDYSNINNSSNYNGYSNNNGNNGKNILIGILIGITVMAVVALCLFVFADRDDDSLKNKSDRYSYSYDDEYEDEDAEEEEEETQESEEEKEEPVVEPDTHVVAPEPGNTVKTGEIAINVDLRYSLNLFLSNFSEASLNSFNKRPSDQELVKFAMNYNTLNHGERWEKGEWSLNGQMYNNRIAEDYIHSSMDDHFTCSIDSSIGKNRNDYNNGYFYAVRTGGLMEGNISIVNYLEYVGDNVYYVRFNMYFTDGRNSGCYRYDDYQISAVGEYAGSGSAYMVASDINNYYTYYLDSYSV